jgi:hypothetical protein
VGAVWLAGAEAWRSGRLEEATEAVASTVHELRESERDDGSHGA